ncbi:MAG: HAMP domain-containing sensor histidine kinase [Syntrophomonadaceae bacterium]|nr:HAMP domain-containing sensor histidine kinase [Syntrophomonadaceae bacterium]
MIQKLQWKFVAIIMSIVAVIFMVIFASVLISTKSGLVKESTHMLEQVLNQPMVPARLIPGPREVQIPYFTVRVWGDSVVIVTGGEYYTLDDEATLLNIVQQSLTAKAEVGVLKDYSLRYMRKSSPEGWRVAYVDTSRESSAMSLLLRNSLIIGLAGMLAFFFISILLARKAVQPIGEAWEQQRQFVADASHELKTPLTVILASADMLAANPEAGAQQQAKWTDNIKAEAVRMRLLVEDMLKLAQADNVSQQAMGGEVDISDVVMNSALTFEPAIFESGRQIKYDIAENLHVTGNAEQLRQLTNILLDNACKYSHPAATIGLTLRAAPKHGVRLTVTSCGDTIPAEQLEKIFERFHRLDPARENNGGYGLGLSIARSIAHAHRGAISAASTDGLTTFTVTLPGT